MDLTIIEELNRGSFKPVYLLYGEEEYLIEKTIQTMKKQMLHPDWSEFNFTTIDLAKTPIETAIEEANNFPFGEGRRLIIGKNAMLFTAVTQKSSVEHRVEDLLAYLEEPADFSSLVLVVPQKKLDERKKIVKEVLKKSRVVVAETLSPDEWEQWIIKTVKEKGIKIDREGLQSLLRYLPKNLLMAQQEIDKLALYSLNDTGEVLKIHDILKIISRTIEGDIFVLIERIANREFSAAYEILQELMKQNEEPIKILALLARQFRMILQCKMMSKEGYSQKQIATHLKLHPYPIKIATEQGKRFKEDQLIEIINQVAELDYHIKSGQRDKQLGLEMLLLQI